MTRKERRENLRDRIIVGLKVMYPQTSREILAKFYDGFADRYWERLARMAVMAGTITVQEMTAACRKVVQVSQRSMIRRTMNVRQVH